MQDCISIFPQNTVTRICCGTYPTVKSGSNGLTTEPYRGNSVKHTLSICLHEMPQVLAANDCPNHAVLHPSLLLLGQSVPMHFRQGLEVQHHQAGSNGAAGV